MNLLEYRHLITQEHVKLAAELVEENGCEWLLERTGRKMPRFRYILVNNNSYPAKAFGYLVAQLAGNVRDKENVMTVNEAVAPLNKLGYTEVNGPLVKYTASADEDKKLSYYLTLARPAQSIFRHMLLEAYNYKCAITGVSVSHALEAAHVKPFSLGGNDTLQNGVLLRADIHRMFDFGLIAIKPGALTVQVSTGIIAEYRAIAGVQITTPFGGPSSDDFLDRWELFCRQHQRTIP